MHGAARFDPKVLNCVGQNGGSWLCPTKLDHFQLAVMCILCVYKCPYVARMSELISVSMWNAYGRHLAMVWMHLPSPKTLFWPITCHCSFRNKDCTHFLILKNDPWLRKTALKLFLTLKLPAGAIYGPIQSQIDAADNSYCQETSLTWIRPVK